MNDEGCCPSVICEMYTSKGMSIPQISENTGLSLSTTRRRLKKLCVLRSRAEGIKLAAKQGRMGVWFIGVKKIISPELRKKMIEAQLLTADKKSRGFGHTSQGYVRYTRGDMKDKLVHIHIMEKHIGRKLNKFECVHHIDGNKTNNDLSNLVLMTKNEHSSLHVKRLNRMSDGKLIKRKDSV